MTICIQVKGIEIPKELIKLPEAYQGFKLEKAVYDPNENKIYLQLSFNNIRHIEVLSDEHSNLPRSCT